MGIIRSRRRESFEKLFGFYQRKSISERQGHRPKVVHFWAE